MRPLRDAFIVRLVWYWLIECKSCRHSKNECIEHYYETGKTEPREGLKIGFDNYVAQVSESLQINFFDQ